MPYPDHVNDAIEVTHNDPASDRCEVSPAREQCISSAGSWFWCQGHVAGAGAGVLGRWGAKVVVLVLAGGRARGIADAKPSDG